MHDAAIRIRKAGDRGHFDYGWLDTFHTFSFGEFHDPRQTGFRSLRVINEDRVAPGTGFGMHPHRDMEIITYVLEGALEHRDSMGNGSVIRAGQLQHMTAGTGIFHSEKNPSATERVHLYQIWILPKARGLEPGYGELALGNGYSPGKLHLVASPEPMAGALTIQQDVRLYLGRLAAGQGMSLRVPAGRAGWLQVTGGAVRLNGLELHAGDGAAVETAGDFTLEGESSSEVLWFDLV